MAINRYNRKETVTSGYSYLSMKNKAAAAAKARAEGELTDAQKIFNSIDTIFENDTIDLSQGTAILNPNKINYNVGRKESKKLTRLLEKLHSDNFFDAVPGSGFTANSAIEKAIDFNNKIVYNNQGVNTFASYTDVVKSYDRLQEMKKAGPGNYLYLFDTETVGGKNTSNIWNPLGITEFAMQKVNLYNGAVEKTNIVLGTADTAENQAIVERILNALGTSLDPNKSTATLKEYADPSKIMNDEELRVTAYRYAIYGSQGSKFENVYDAHGKVMYQKAVSLAGSDLNDWLDPEKIKKGYLMNVGAYKASPMTEYGFNVAQKTFIDSMSEMYKAANAGTGMIGGQNIVPFDIQVVNAELARIRGQLQAAVDGTGDGTITAKTAQKGLDYLNKAFGGQVGFSAPSEQIFDTLPMINFIREKFGVDALYNFNQEAIMKAGLGTAKQENVGAVWFPELFASGEAHMADFDVDVLRNIFTTPIDQLGGRTFMEHFMEAQNGTGLKGLGIEAQTIKAGGEQQLFYAKKGTRDRTFGGKSNLDHTYNKKTGEVFFSSNYEIMNHNSKPRFAGEINMGTHINKGQFYYIDSIKKMSADDLAKDLGDVLPELSGPDVFQVRMRMATGGKHKDSSLSDLEYVFHFNSEYELSGWLSSNYDMAFTKDENGKWVVNSKNALDYLEQVELKDGQLHRDPGFYLQSVDNMIDESLEAKNGKLLTERAARDINDPVKSYNKIKQQLDMRKTLSKAGLDNVSEDEIKSILSGVPVERMNKMSKKDSDALITQIKKIAGFKQNGVGEEKLYSNTVNKVAASWGFVSAQDDFYMKVFDNLDKYADANSYTKKQRQVMFDRVVENLKTQVANEMYESSEQVRGAVHNSRSFKGSLNDLKNVYDIELPEGFAIEQPKIKEIQSGINMNAGRNIVSVRLDNTNTSSAGAQLANQLVKAKYGDRDLKMNPEHYKRIAMYNFVEHLSELEDFQGRKGIQEALEHMNADTKNFSLDTVSRLVLGEMKNIKDIDPSKGLIREISTSSLEILPEFNDALSKVKDSVIRQAIEATPAPLDLPSTGTADAIRNFVKTDVLKHYMPSRDVFESTLKGLSDEEVWQKTLLYNTLEEQITNSLADITGALSAVPNSELSIMPDGRFVFKEGNRAVTLDAIPQIKLDGNTLYGQVGRSPVQVHLEYGINKQGGAYITTNLGESYEKNRVVAGRIRKRLKDGTYRMEDSLNITSHLSEAFRQDSRYEFKSGDYFSNFMVGTGELDTIMPRLFSPNGDLRHYGKNIGLPEDVMAVLAKAFEDAGKEIEAGGIDPVMGQYLTAYRAQILQGLAEQTGDENIQRLASGLTIGTKGKGKLQKGKMMGSNLRFETGAMNAFENLGRPVVDGSGNVKFIPSRQIEEAAEKVKGLFYEGALFESSASERINRKIVDGVGEISTGWTSRTAYVGEIGLKTIINNNFDTVMKNNTVRKMEKEQKENIYNMLNAYLNTFEQQKVLNARSFDAVTQGRMSANVVKLSSAKDIVNVVKDEKYAAKYQRLMDLMGNIEMSPEGIINYKSSVGEIVKYGETIVPFASYGGDAERWTSKMNRGLLSFQVTNKQGVKLTDEQISAVLNQNKGLFKNIDMNDRAQVLKAFNKSLGDYEVNFAVEDINRMTLPKILANDSEKAMNHILYAKTGSVDSRVARVFKAYGDETAELVQGTVLTEQAFEAYFKDESKRLRALRAGNFSSWGSFKKAWEQEMYTMSDVIFGKGGLFEGFTDIANDNLFGHENKGTMLVGSLNEAVAMLGKYSSGGVENQQSRIKGMEEFIRMYNDNEEYQFIRNKNGAVKLELVNGHFRLENGRSFNESLENADVIDYQKLEGMVRNIDEFVKSKGAGKQDWLVHQDDEAGEIIGRVLYSGDKIVGTVGSTHKKIVLDPETQSSMPQEYFDTKMDYMKLKGERINLENKLNDLADAARDGNINAAEEFTKTQIKLNNLETKLDDMDEYLKNMETTGHAYRVGDQETKIIKNYFLNQDSYNAIQERIATGKISQATVDSNESLRRLGKQVQDEDNYKVFGSFLNELHDQKYYNPYIDNKVLTKDMVEEGGKYAHLKGVYDNLVGGGHTKKLGVDTAEIIQNIRMAELANEFNNSKIRPDKQKLIDAGFEVMTPDQYLNQFGDPGVAGYSSVFKENVLLKLDMGDGIEDYVAVPGMGSVLEKAEIKQDWHTYAGRLSKVYREEFEPMHGSPIGRDEVIEKMENIKTDLRKSTAGYMEKGSEFHLRMQQEVHAAVDRVKIMSTMNDPNNPLLKQAMIDGKSIADWVQEGVYYDYAFDSMEAFEKRGYFKKDFLDKMGMNREEMIEHLRTEGTIMLDDRYPNIRERSITPVRHYLAVDNQGMSLIANNATLMAPHTMLAMNADSDGDSVSRFLVKHNGTDQLEYGIAKSRAREVAKQMDFANTDQYDNWVRTQTIQNMTDAGIKNAEEAYDVFDKQEMKMAQMAANENINWQAKVVDTWEGDFKKTRKAMALKYGDDFTQAEVVGGKSILGYTKLTALSETPGLEEMKTNVEKINNMLNVIQKNSQYLDDATREGIKDILENPADILSHNKEADVLDRAIDAVSKLAKADSSIVSETGFNTMQTEAIKRIRINKLHEEGMQKLGVTATGNVNTTLYGISQAIKSRYGDVEDPLYNEVKRAITSEMSYLLEETPISYKHEKVKAGDTRLIEFGNVFRKMEQEGATQENIENMQNYFKKYMNHGSIEDAYNMIQDRMGTPMSSRLTDRGAIVDEMVSSYTSFIQEALDKSSDLYAEVQLYKSAGRRKPAADAIHKARGRVATNASNAAEGVFEITGQNTTSANIPRAIVNESAEKNAREAIENFTPPPSSSNTKLASEAVESASNTVARAISGAGGFKTGLGVAAVGLAAGLLVAGYASGNPLNDPDPATITKEGHVTQAPNMSFGSGGQGFAPNNTGGYIINIKGDTKKGNRQLRKALKQATRNSVGPSGINMNVKTSNSNVAYNDRDMENFLNNYF